DRLARLDRAFERRGERPVAVEHLTPIAEPPARLAPEAEVERVERQHVVRRPGRAGREVVAVAPPRHLEPPLRQLGRGRADGPIVDPHAPRPLDPPARPRPHSKRVGRPGLLLRRPILWHAVTSSRSMEQYSQGKLPPNPPILGGTGAPLTPNSGGNRCTAM